jgi:hypothetical protein
LPLGGWSSPSRRTACCRSSRSTARGRRSAAAPGRTVRRRCRGGVEVVQVRGDLRHAEAAVLVRRRQRVVAPHQGRRAIAGHDDRPRRARRIGAQVLAAQVEAPEGLGRQRGVHDHVGVGADAGLVEHLRGNRSRDWWGSERPSNGRPVTGLMARLGLMVGAGSSSPTLRCGSTGGTPRGSTNGVIDGRAPSALGLSSSRGRPRSVTSTPALDITPIFIRSRRVRPDATVS